jgi:hypothetical protein
MCQRSFAAWQTQLRQQEKTKKMIMRQMLNALLVEGSDLFLKKSAFEWRRVLHGRWKPLLKKLLLWHEKLLLEAGACRRLLCHLI